MSQENNTKLSFFMVLMLSFCMGLSAYASDEMAQDDTGTHGRTQTQNVDTSSNSTLPDTAYLGVMYGGTMQSNSTNGLTTSNTQSTYGLTLGGKFTRNFGLGVLGTYRSETATGNFLGLPAGTSSKEIIATGQANIFVGAFHLGGEVGPEFDSWSGAVSSVHSGTSNTSVVYGPEAGVDLRLASALSIGVDAHYLITTDSSNLNNLEGFAVLKIWE